MMLVTDVGDEEVDTDFQILVTDLTVLVTHILYQLAFSCQHHDVTNITVGDG